MISNCKVIHVFESEEMPFHLYEAIDRSMVCPLKYSIRAGDVLLCEKHNLLPDIEGGTAALIDSDYYVVHSFFEKEFAAKIITIDVEKERISFNFINPDQKQYPDQSLWFHEIRAIYKVNSVQSGAMAVPLEGGTAV